MGTPRARAASLFEEVTGLGVISCDFNGLRARRDFYAELEGPRAKSLIERGPCDLDGLAWNKAVHHYRAPSPKRVVMG